MTSFRNETLSPCELLGSKATGQIEKPALVFLHGLLGSADDWKAVTEALSQDHFCLAIDLPGHGESKHIPPVSFEHTNTLIMQIIEKYVQGAYWLVGYSLGARLAMMIAANHQADGASEKATHLRGLLIESGHTGLPDSERESRWQNDCRWAHRFESEPIVDVLQDWYEQPVFSSLNHAQKQSFVALRSDNLGVKVASMLRATSLSKQPELSEPLRQCELPLHYVCGQNDTKFSAVAARSGFRFNVVPDAGHNIHAEQPRLFSQLIKKLITTV
ncbi:2-succinyl-6-hydroxy-2,4-cyclohexadiene-1-carboxylate synthase [Enterovibrio norvegicus]|uniref:2-succinyl-6-hydroxy-2, 4-cyclohexadiene-1-carboxylate synthase n=1 Tax=Enterovibrio norvegicus TaxID=188144 RepID=UPI00352F711E